MHKLHRNFSFMAALGFFIACSAQTPLVDDPVVDDPVVDDPVVDDPIVENIVETQKDFLVRIVFAGDLASGGGCADHGTEDRCDLFEATVDLSSGNVESVEQITDTTESESYPAWNPNGEVVYYSVFKTAKTKNLGYVELSSGGVGVLVEGASWPTVSPDGGSFLYVLNKTKTIMQASLSSDGLTLGEGTALTGVANQQDPDFSSDGTAIVFHDTSAGEGRAAVFDLETGKTVSYGMRAGHCTFGALSFITVCDNASAGGLFSAYYKDGALSEVELFVADQKPAVLAELDPALAACSGTSFNYPTFCSDDEHLLVSTSCNQGGSVSFSRLFIVDLSQDETKYYPLGMHLQEAFGGQGQSSWTVSCLHGQN